MQLCGVSAAFYHSLINRPSNLKTWWSLPSGEQWLNHGGQSSDSGLSWPQERSRSSFTSNKSWYPHSQDNKIRFRMTSSHNHGGLKSVRERAATYHTPTMCPALCDVPALRLCDPRVSCKGRKSITPSLQLASLSEFIKASSGKINLEKDNRWWISPWSSNISLQFLWKWCLGFSWL